MLHIPQIVAITLLAIINLTSSKLGILNIVFFLVYLGQLGVVAISWNFGYFQSSYCRNLAMIPFHKEFIKVLIKGLT